MRRRWQWMLHWSVVTLSLSLLVALDHELSPPYHLVVVGETLFKKA